MFNQSKPQPRQEPWNKGKLIGQKLPLTMQEIWSIRMRLQTIGNVRDLALFNLAIDSNYGYTLHKPHAPTLLDYLGPWPWYIIGAEGVALIMFLMLYSPYLLGARKSTGASIAGAELNDMAE